MAPASDEISPEPLTPLQCRLLTLIGQGYTANEAAHEMGYSHQYMKNVLWDAYKRLDIWGDRRIGDKRTRAVVLAWQQGLIEIPVRVPRAS